MTKSHDTPQIIKEIRKIYRAGAELVRVAVPDEEALQSFAEIVKKSPIPVIADVHFSPALALGAIEAGTAKLRINPGNIRSKRDLKKIAMTAKDRGIPLRIGVNSGSLPPAIIKKFKHPTAEAMIAALSESVKLFEDFGFDDLVLAAKSSDVLTTIEVYRAMHEKFGYPLHLGVTEAGLPFEGAIRSTAAMAPLLLDGIGDTIRISLTGPAEKEVEACWELLRSLGLRERGVKLIACPGCARTEIDIQRLAREVKKRLAWIKEPLTVAVMGCVVNGPGEAQEADYGIAAGKGKGVIFRKGEVVATVSEEKLLDSLVFLIQKDLV
jgi:(E)-4-hydroxy-3-methylbut-2-enyl-diphosphate synthase